MIFKLYHGWYSYLTNLSQHTIMIQFENHLAFDYVAKNYSYFDHASQDNLNGNFIMTDLQLTDLLAHPKRSTNTYNCYFE